MLVFRLCHALMESIFTLCILYQDFTLHSDNFSTFFYVVLDKLFYAHYLLFKSVIFYFLGEGSDVLPFTSVSGPA